MGSFRLDDRGHSHAKVVTAGNAAYGAWTRAGQWSSDYGTNGFIPRAVALSIAPAKFWVKLRDARAGHTHGLVEEQASGWQLRDPFEDDAVAAANESPSPTTSEARREAGRAGGTRSGEVRRAKQAGRATEANPKQDEANPKQDEATSKQNEATSKQNEAPQPGQLALAIPRPDLDPDAGSGSGSGSRSRSPDPDPLTPSVGGSRSGSTKVFEPTPDALTVLEAFQRAPTLHVIASAEFAQKIAGYIEPLTPGRRLHDLLDVVGAVDEIEARDRSLPGARNRNARALAGLLIARIKDPKRKPRVSDDAPPDTAGAALVREHYGRRWARAAKEMYASPAADLVPAGALWTEAVRASVRLATDAKGGASPTAAAIAEHWVDRFFADADRKVIDACWPIAWIERRIGTYSVPAVRTPRVENAVPTARAERVPASGPPPKGLLLAGLARTGPGKDGAFLVRPQILPRASNS